MIKGAYQLRVIDSGKCISDTGEVRNLILNEALNHGDPFSSGFICVGDGDSEPYSTQAALDNQLGQVSGTFSSNATIFMDGQDRYARRSVTVSLTGIDGDIREVGYKKLTEGDLLSRTLIRDGNGVLTRIPIESHQTLEVTFFVYVLIPQVLASGVINVGVGGDTEFTVAPAETMDEPKGFLSGRFNDPIAGDSLKMILTNGDVIENSSSSVSYDSENQTCRLLVNWAASETSREIEKLEGTGNNRLIAQFASPVSLLADVDFTVDVEFNWSLM